MYFNYKEYLKNSASYREMFRELDLELKTFMKHFNDDPRFVSGWGHGYFCDEDGGKLIYDLSKPHEHECSVCHKVYTGYRYDSCYITMLRNEAAVTAVKAGILYNISENKYYIDVLKEIIEFYAENYKYFCIHAKDKLNCDPIEDVGGAGKIMPQGLNEAIIAIRFINALELVKESLTGKWIADLKEKLFRPLYQLLLPQKMHIHNIPVWINSAIGVMGFFYQEEEWIKEATEHPYNMIQQLEKGITGSGFWYEGSIHYNFFALEGIMNFLIFAKIYGFNISKEAEEAVFRMLEAAYYYAFDNDIFPNPGDGWPDVGLKTYVHIYYMAYKVFGKRVSKYLNHIERNPLIRSSLPLTEPYYYHNEIPLERILFAPNLNENEIETTPVEARSSISFEESNCGILKNDTFNVFLKYGHRTPSHAHPDKMGIEILINKKAYTRDLSNSGYASKMCNGWYRKAESHNTCILDGTPGDISKQGHLLKFTESHIAAEAEVYKGTVFRRIIQIEQESLKDIFQVESDHEHVIDWFFHFENTIERDQLHLLKAEKIKEYGYFMELHEIKTTGILKLKNKLAEMILYSEDGVKIYIAKSYNNPANRLRDSLILRKISNRAEFRYELKIRD